MTGNVVLALPIYDVRPSATKTDFFPKNPSLKNAVFFNVGVAGSIFTGQICFRWLIIFSDLFLLCPPQYVMLPPVTEHVSLHSKSLCKNIARASGGCK